MLPEDGSLIVNLCGGISGSGEGGDLECTVWPSGGSWKGFPALLSCTCRPVRPGNVIEGILSPEGSLVDILCVDEVPISGSSRARMISSRSGLWWLGVVVKSWSVPAGRMAAGTYELKEEAKVCSETLKPAPRFEDSNLGVGDDVLVILGSEENSAWKISRRQCVEKYLALNVALASHLKIQRPLILNSAFAPI